MPSSTAPAPQHAPFLALAKIVQNNLEYQADWKELELHTSAEFPRPLLTGIPPEPIYSEKSPLGAAANTTLSLSLDTEDREREWVLPVDLREKWSVRKCAEVFDAMPEVGGNRKKRLSLAVASDDSTVVYYVVHDGIVKPRQN